MSARSGSKGKWKLISDEPGKYLYKEREYGWSAKVNTHDTGDVIISVPRE